MRVSKWKQFKILRGHKEVCNFLPKTKVLTKTTLWNILDEFTEIIIKPSKGRFGRKVIQVSMVDENQFEIHSEDGKIIINGRKQTFKYLKKNYLTSKFIIQEKISLSTINGCPFDLRVMVQRENKSTNWEVTGMLAKVAYEGYIITNIAENILPIELAIQNSSIQNAPIQDLVDEINHTVVEAAKQFQTVYPSCKMIGFDIGIDEERKIWIIEANFHPVISIFKRLEDESIYLKIKKYQSGRISV